ncbi:hypothetical protein DY023_00265 [Microbacterium bovistercoris]|uniref:DUF4232 domain-containing protein n=1 Tax=Microbacterium bovistercoris TaxID=2293570 RepID=A0A371NYK5_9MICO|nr:hypothetical protein [Microbacterium bovistercoris]REJ08760.1 hypothetical protein DY023_00265 [Microbacterium bovistercoris]
MSPRHSAAVYRRRRLVVIALAVVLLAAIGGGVWLAIAQPWSDEAGAPATQSASPSKSGEESPSASPSEVAPKVEPTPDDTPVIVACTAADVTVDAITDASTYAAGKNPQLSIRLKNTGAKDCTINVGSTTQKFTVSSGSDVWWRSTDCQKDPSDMIVTLKAGQSVDSAQPVVWDRTRSSVKTCDDKNRPKAPGGGASYHVSVSIGGFDSAQSEQILLY